MSNLNRSGLEFEVTKKHYNTSALGELRLTPGEKVILIDEESVFLKVQMNGRIGFAPLSCLNGAGNNDNEHDQKLIVMVHHQHSADKKDEASIDVGQLVTVKAVSDDAWCFGKSGTKMGWFPCNHLSPLFGDFQKHNIPNNRLYRARSLSVCSELGTGERVDNPNQSKTPSFESTNPEKDAYVTTSVEKCQTHLDTHGVPGDYVVRLRTHGKSLGVMVVTPEGVKNFIVSINNEGKFSLGSFVAPSLPELLEIFKETPISFCKNGSAAYLKNQIQV